MRDYVAEKIGERYITPLLGVWENPDEIDLNALPERFVLKCSHNSGGVITCLDKASFNWEGAKRALKRQLSSNYYAVGREWLYKDILARACGGVYWRRGRHAAAGLQVFLFQRRCPRDDRLYGSNRKARELLLFRPRL